VNDGCEVAPSETNLRRRPRDRRR